MDESAKEIQEGDEGCKEKGREDNICPVDGERKEGGNIFNGGERGQVCGKIGKRGGIAVAQEV